MKIVQFLLFPALLTLALACGQTGSDNGGQPVGATIDTLPVNDSAAYTIMVLDGEKPSPRKEMKGKIGGTEITVNYGSPSVRNRVIWGGLEPYGEVWRTGANEATSIQFSVDVQVEGKALKAGRYGFFAIPNEDKWTLIFNSVADQWGAFDYDAAKDVLRVDVIPQSKGENAEQLDYQIEGNAVILRWEKLAVPFTIAAAQ